MGGGGVSECGAGVGDSERIQRGFREDSMGMGGGGFGSEWGGLSITENGEDDTARARGDDTTGGTPAP